MDSFLQDIVDAVDSNYAHEGESIYRIISKENQRLNTRRGQRTYRRRHPELVRARALLYRRRDGQFSKVIAAHIKAQMELQNGRCYWCDKVVGLNYHVDHVIPLTRGGTSEPENLVISCPKCNLRKGNKLPSEWATMRIT